jgi:hypothetical protein
MGDPLGSLVQGSQKRTILYVIRVGCYTMGGWVKSGMSDAGGSNAGGWVHRWSVGGAPWVGGVERWGGGGVGGATLKSLSNWL